MFEEKEEGRRRRNKENVGSEETGEGREMFKDQQKMKGRQRQSGSEAGCILMRREQLRKRKRRCRRRKGGRVGGVEGRGEVVVGGGGGNGGRIGEVERWGERGE